MQVYPNDSTCRCDTSFSVYAESQGRAMRKDSTDFTSALPMPECDKSFRLPNPIMEPKLTGQEEFLVRRLKEWQLCRSQIRKANCRQQLAVFVKYPTGKKYLVGIVNFYRKGKKLFGGNLSPVLWFDVSREYRVTLRGQIDVKDSLPEAFMRKMIDCNNPDVKVYAQRLDHVRKPKSEQDRKRQLKHERFHAPKYQPGDYLYGRPLNSDVSLYVLN